MGQAGAVQSVVWWKRCGIVGKPLYPDASWLIIGSTSREALISIWTGRWFVTKSVLRVTTSAPHSSDAGSGSGTEAAAVSWDRAVHNQHLPPGGRKLKGPGPLSKSLLYPRLASLALILSSSSIGVSSVRATPLASPMSKRATSFCFSKLIYTLCPRCIRRSDAQRFVGSVTCANEGSGALHCR